MNKSQIKKIVVAGKIGLLSTNIYGNDANCTVEGSSTTTNNVTNNTPSGYQLTLNQTSTPTNLITTPSNEQNGSIWIGNMSSDETLVMDFTVSGPTLNLAGNQQLYFAYSTGAGRADAWVPSTKSGQLELDPDTLQLIAAVKLTYPENVAEFPAIPLGSVNAVENNIKFSVNLSQALSDPSLEGNNLYFQAIIISIDEEGQFLWDEAHVTELDHYMIKREKSDSNTSAECPTTDTNTDSGGKQ